MAKLTHASTDERLLEALVELTQTQSIHKIQVRELCAKAHINRTTFYKHYENMDVYIDALIASFFKQMNDAFFYKNVFVHIIDVNAQETFLQCVTFMTGHMPFLAMMLGPNGAPAFRSRLGRMWSEQIEEALVLRRPQLQDTVNIEILGCYITSTMLGLLDFLVASKGKYSAEYIAQQMTHLIYNCTMRCLLEDKV